MRRLIVILMFWSPLSIAFIDPYFGVLSYSLMNIVRPEQLMWGDRSAAGRIYLMTQFVCFLSWFINRDKERLSPKDTPLPASLIIMLLMAIQMTISTNTSNFYTHSWAWTTNFWKTLLFCFIMTKSMNSPKKIELYYALVLVWMTFLALWGIQQKFGGNARMENLGGDQLSDINDISSVYVMYVPMAYYSLFSRKKWIRLWIAIPSFLVFVIFLLFGGSRGAFMGLTACMGLIFWRAEGSQKFKMIATMLIVGLLLGFTLSKIAPEGFFDEYSARLKTIFGEENESTGEVEHEASSAGRIAMWKSSWAVFIHHPQFWMIGVGVRCYPQFYGAYLDFIYQYLEAEEFSHIYGEGRGGKAIHNTQLNLLMSGGFPLVLLWHALFFNAWGKAHNFSKKYPKIIDDVNMHNYSMALEIGLVGWWICMSFLNLELVDFFYWHVTMAGVVTNIGKARLKREIAGLDEDEEFFGTATAK